MGQRGMLAGAVGLAVGALVALSPVDIASAATPSVTASLASSDVSWNGSGQSLNLNVANASSCTITATGPLAVAPVTISPCTGSITQPLALPANTGYRDASYALTVTALLGRAKATTKLSFIQRHQVRIQFFGDSYGFQAIPYLQSLATSVGASFQFAAFPGASMCDAIDPAAATAASWHPDLVVVEYLGTNFSACAQQGGTYGSRQWLAAYKTATGKVVKAALKSNTDTRVYLVDAPILPGQDAVKDTIPSIYQAVAAQKPAKVAYNNAGLAVEGPGGSFVQNMVCLPFEVAGTQPPGLPLPGSCTGPVVHGVQRNAVRGPGGSHFCSLPNVPWPPVGCPAVDAKGAIIVVDGVVQQTYASGAYRFAAAMLYPGLVAFSLSPLPVFLN